MNTVITSQTVSTSTISTHQFDNPFSQQFGDIVFYQAFNLLKAKARDKKIGLTAAEHILYNMVRNHPLNRGFTPITNKIKLSNGQYPDQGFDIAKGSLKFSISRNFDAYIKAFGLPVESKDYWLSLLA